MKKNLFIAALLCGISFAGKAATNEVKPSATMRKPVNTTKVCKLFEMIWTCPSGAYTISCYGFTQKQAEYYYNYYNEHLDC